MRQESGKDKYGINMGKWCRSHEEELAALTERAGEDVSALRDVLELHETRLAFLQHERLVHLIVLVMTVFGELFVVGLVLCLPDTFPDSFLIVIHIGCIDEPAPVFKQRFHGIHASIMVKRIGPEPHDRHRIAAV